MTCFNRCTRPTICNMLCTGTYHSTNIGPVITAQIGFVFLVGFVTTVRFIKFLDLVRVSRLHALSVTIRPDTCMDTNRNVTMSFLTTRFRSHRRKGIGVNINRIVMIKHVNPATLCTVILMDSQRLTLRARPTIRIMSCQGTRDNAPLKNMVTIMNVTIISVRNITSHSALGTG